ncbi:DinB family protein [Mucilaginibacter gracilis]|uniref:DinB family protein n=1 Tax=Mucilaginibacter gracilis TaxID=423350 RepID=A0A495J2C4_9SPHI|nr:DinB family protein [Mucilaginibacter gracilis]RKR82484.1 DinB family protein [Mucilaginibacter gracilis]
MENNDKITRQHLTALITQGNAHATLNDALDNLPAKLRGVVPDGLPYSIWQLAEHIRIAQWDILEFTKNQTHQSPKWPDEYWPKEAEPTDAAWDKTIAQIKNNQDEFVALLNDTGNDLYKPLPQGTGQTLLREALLIADHAAYHTAEIIVIRRLLGAWK